MLLRKCVDQWGALIDDPVRLRHDTYPDDVTTHRDLLSHTAPGRVGYAYSPERFADLTPVTERCAQMPYRRVLWHEVFERFAMLDSVPDHLLGSPTADDALQFSPAVLDRFAQAIGRMALPYRVIGGRAQRSSDVIPTRANAADGIVSSVRDLARFDAMVSQGLLLAPDTRVASWTQQIAGGLPLPTGLGWFVQSYRGEPIVWQFGLVRGGYSALILKAPNRGLTFVLLANSDGLSAPYDLERGDVTASLFAQLFLRFFVP
jgi:CubicO group peptidase (beta-lactamase class C family)